MREIPSLPYQKIKYWYDIRVCNNMSTNGSDLLDVGLDPILRTTIDEASDGVLVVNPSADTIRAFVKIAAEYDDLPVVKLYADGRTVKTVMEDFIVASNAADLIERDDLEIRTTEEDLDNSLLVTDTAVVALVDAGSEIGGLSTDDKKFIDAAFDAYEAEFERAEPFSLRTPPLSRVRETLADDIGPDTEEDFNNILASLETARGNGDGLDEVTISLLVAAKNEVLLYDISRWGEDVGIASKATFSRTKTKLEDMGIIDTEKVPIDVGRPRLRLKLGDDRLKNADEDQLASMTQSLLA